MAKPTKKLTTAEEIQIFYEKQLIAKEFQLEQAVTKLYTNIIQQIAPLAAMQNLPGGVFALEKLPVLNTRIEQYVQQLVKSVEVQVRSGINDIWKLSNEKNNYIADIRLEKSLIPANARVAFYDTNIGAMQAFEDRVISGLNLSDRIYKAGETFVEELEAGIGVGIANGTSAAELARDLRGYLKNPNDLVDAVNQTDDLNLSKKSDFLNPGTGVYKSSTANIYRLTRTEINQAYRTADNTRWQQQPFVIGQEVKTSGAHPKFDVCDIMAGLYPKDFIFIGWHPQCICFAVPKLMNDQQFGQYQKLVLSGEDTPENIGRIVRPIVDLPEAATKYVEDNAQRFANWKNPPLWYTQNSNLLPDLPPSTK